VLGIFLELNVADLSGPRTRSCLPTESAFQLSRSWRYFWTEAVDFALIGCSLEASEQWPMTESEVWVPTVWQRAVIGCLRQ
jgi:hypothetical protein